MYVYVETVDLRGVSVCVGVCVRLWRERSLVEKWLKFILMMPFVCLSSIVMSLCLSRRARETAGYQETRHNGGARTNTRVKKHHFRDWSLFRCGGRPFDSAFLHTCMLVFLVPCIPMSTTRFLLLLALCMLSLAHHPKSFCRSCLCHLFVFRHFVAFSPCVSFHRPLAFPFLV